MVGRNDPCPCGSGRKFKKCCLPQNNASANKEINPNSRVGRLLQLYNELEILSKMYLQEKPSYPCKIGCSECCSDLFLIYPEEYALIECGINSLQEDQLLLISQNAIHYYNEIVKDISNFETMFEEKYFNENFNKIFDTLEKVKIPCPFLIKNMCTIYEYRPSICRMYGFIHVYDEKEGRLFWTSKCSKLNDPLTHGINLPKSFVDIRLRSGINSTPLPIILWLKINLTDAINFEEFQNEMFIKPLQTPRIDIGKLLNYLVNKGIITPPKDFI